MVILLFLPLAWCAAVSGVELSPPPAGIFVVVGEDTNNGQWPNVDLKCIAVVGGENS